MLFGAKRKEFHSAVANTMLRFVPTLNSRDIQLFTVLMKFKIDDLYKNGATSELAAMALSAYYFPEVLNCAIANDKEFFRYFGPYTAWLGACADYVVNETQFLNTKEATELRRFLALSASVKFPPDPSVTIGQLIEEQKHLSRVIKTEQRTRE